MNRQIKRRDFLKKGTLAGLFVPSALLAACKNEEKIQENALGIPTDFSKKYEWKMTTTWPPHFPILGEGPEMFARLVREMSGGRLIIRVSGAGELAPALEAFEAVSSGAVEIAHSCAYYWAGKTGAAQFFAALPFGLNAQQMLAWVKSGGGMALWEKLYEPFGLIPLIGGNTGVQMGGWFNKKIEKIEDFQGLKIRMPGLGAKVLAKVGASPVTVAGGEIYTNLERGVIDASEWIGPYHDYKMGFHRIAKYYYYPGWHEPGSLLEFIINKEKFAALPTDLQYIVRTAADAVSNWIFTEFEVKNSEYLEKIKKESQVEIIKFPDKVMQQLRQHGLEVCQQLAQENQLAKEVYQSYLDFRTKAIAWSEITEKTFFSDIQPT